MSLCVYVCVSVVMWGSVCVSVYKWGMCVSACVCVCVSACVNVGMCECGHLCVSTRVRGHV